MTKCKGCGRDMIWAVNPATGARIPLDPVAPVYVVEQTEGNEFTVRRAPQKFNSGEAIYCVSHFSTCPKADEFSSSRNTVKDKNPQP